VTVRPLSGPALGRHGETTTSIVFSSPVANRTLTRLEAAPSAPAGEAMPPR